MESRIRRVSWKVSKVGSVSESTLKQETQGINDSMNIPKIEGDLAIRRIFSLVDMFTKP